MWATTLPLHFVNTTKTKSEKNSQRVTKIPGRVRTNLNYLQSIKIKDEKKLLPQQLSTEQSCLIAL